VSVLDQGISQADHDPNRPSYSAWHHYEKPEDWSAASQKRLKQWGFSTIGGWADLAALRSSGVDDFWLMPVVHIGSRSGAPWWDMWDAKLLDQMDQTARNFIAPLRGDPRVIGYYSDNEIGWWDASLWKLTLEQSASSGQRRRLINLLRQTYHDDWNALLKDFEPENAQGWQELDRGGMLWHRPGSNGIRTIRKFLSLAAERYYELMDGLIRKYDPDALFLGDRYQSFYYLEVARASKRHVDVVSTNLNASWNDGTFLKSYFDTLRALTGKPIHVSEFYMAAHQNRSGNRNSSSGFPTVDTQRERAEALSNTVRALARLPYVVGAEWFQYYDEPTFGRSDGEDYNFGLVDIHDRPYTEVTETFASLNPTQLKASGAPALPSASAGIPAAPADPFAKFEFMSALKDWDRERGFVPPSSAHPIGDLYVCWSPGALYLGVYVLDVVDDDLYRSTGVPVEDRGEWRVRLGGQPPVKVLVGYGDPPKVTDDDLRVKSISGLDHNMRSIIVLEYPAGRLGRKQFKPGDSVELDASYTTHGRMHKIEWKGNFPLIE
jgi:hypothetical protein